jgi:hypothetical protein
MEARNSQHKKKQKQTDVSSRRKQPNWLGLPTMQYILNFEVL